MNFIDIVDDIKTLNEEMDNITNLMIEATSAFDDNQHNSTENTTESADNYKFYAPILKMNLKRLSDVAEYLSKLAESLNKKVI